jgi:hypothetical protein
MSERLDSNVYKDNMYLVYDERGGRMQVTAIDKNDAIEKYWECMESIFGHIEKSCDCFKNPLPFPREKYLQPVSVKKLKDIK